MADNAANEGISVVASTVTSVEQTKQLQNDSQPASTHRTKIGPIHKHHKKKPAPAVPIVTSGIKDIKKVDTIVDEPVYATVLPKEQRKSSVPTASNAENNYKPEDTSVRKKNEKSTKSEQKGLLKYMKRKFHRKKSSSDSDTEDDKKSDKKTNTVNKPTNMSIETEKYTSNAENNTKPVIAAKPQNTVSRKSDSSSMSNADAEIHAFKKKTEFLKMTKGRYNVQKEKNNSGNMQNPPNSVTDNYKYETNSEFKKEKEQNPANLKKNSMAEPRIDITISPRKSLLKESESSTSDSDESETNKIKQNKLAQNKQDRDQQNKSGIQKNAKQHDNETNPMYSKRMSVNLRKNSDTSSSSSLDADIKNIKQKTVDSLRTASGPKPKSEDQIKIDNKKEYSTISIETGTNLSANTNISMQPNKSVSALPNKSDSIGDISTKPRAELMASQNTHSLKNKIKTKTPLVFFHKSKTPTETKNSDSSSSEDESNKSKATENIQEVLGTKAKHPQGTERLIFVNPESMKVANQLSILKDTPQIGSNVVDTPKNESNSIKLMQIQNPQPTVLRRSDSSSSSSSSSSCKKKDKSNNGTEDANKPTRKYLIKKTNVEVKNPIFLAQKPKPVKPVVALPVVSETPQIGKNTYPSNTEFKAHNTGQNVNVPVVSKSATRKDTYPINSSSDSDEKNKNKSANIKTGVTKELKKSPSFEYDTLKNKPDVKTPKCTMSEPRIKIPVVSEIPQMGKNILIKSEEKETKAAAANKKIPAVSNLKPERNEPSSSSSSSDDEVIQNRANKTGQKPVIQRKPIAGVQKPILSQETIIKTPGEVVREDVSHLEVSLIPKVTDRARNSDSSSSSSSDSETDVKQANMEKQYLLLKNLQPRKAESEVTHAETQLKPDILTIHDTTDSHSSSSSDSEKIVTQAVIKEQKLATIRKLSDEIGNRETVSPFLQQPVASTGLPGRKRTDSSSSSSSDNDGTKNEKCKNSHKLNLFQKQDTSVQKPFNHQKEPTITLQNAPKPEIKQELIPIGKKHDLTASSSSDSDISVAANKSTNISVQIPMSLVHLQEKEKGAIETQTSPDIPQIGQLKTSRPSVENANEGNLNKTTSIPIASPRRKIPKFSSSSSSDNEEQTQQASDPIIIVTNRQPQNEVKPVVNTGKPIVTLARKNSISSSSSSDENKTRHKKPLESPRQIKPEISVPIVLDLPQTGKNIHSTIPEEKNKHATDPPILIAKRQLQSDRKPVVSTEVPIVTLARQKSHSSSSCSDVNETSHKKPFKNPTQNKPEISVPIVLDMPQAGKNVYNTITVDKKPVVTGKLHEHSPEIRLSSSTSESDSDNDNKYKTTAKHTNVGANAEETKKHKTIAESLKAKKNKLFGIFKESRDTERKKSNASSMSSINSSDQDLNACKESQNLSKKKNKNSVPTKPTKHAKPKEVAPLSVIQGDTLSNPKNSKEMKSKSRDIFGDKEYKVKENSDTSSSSSESSMDDSDIFRQSILENPVQYEEANFSKHKIDEILSGTQSLRPILMPSNKAEIKPTWVNEKFLEVALSNVLDKNTKIANFCVSPAVGVGENYACDVFRVKVQTSKTKLQLLLKCMPEQELRAKLMTEAKLTEREVHVYNHALPLLKGELDTPKYPKCYYTLLDGKRDTLVFEDMQPLGYSTAPRRKGLDAAHCRLALTELAHLHGFSAAMHKLDPVKFDIEIRGKYPEIMYVNERKDLLGQLLSNGILGIAAAIKKHLPMRYHFVADILTDIAPNIFDILQTALNTQDGVIVFNHGDFWSSNILFRYTKSSRHPLACSMIDFQVCRCASPAFDLLYFLYTSTEQDVRKKHEEELLQTYLNEVHWAMSIRGVTDPKGYFFVSLDELRNDLRKHAIFGFLTACFVMPIVVSNQEDALDMSQIKEEDIHSLSNQWERTYKGEIFCRRMRHIIEDFDDMGLFEDIKNNKIFKYSTLI